MIGSRIRLWPALLFLGCGSGEQEPSVDEHFSLQNWVQTVAEQPTQFAESIASSREGWIALHAGQLADISPAGSDSAIAYRAHAEKAAFYYRLARITRYAWRMTSEAWSARPLPDQPKELSAFPTLANLSGRAVGSAAPQEVPSGASDVLGLSASKALELAKKPTQFTANGTPVQHPLAFQALYLRHAESLAAVQPPEGIQAVLFSGCAVSPVATDPASSFPYNCLEEGLLGDLGFTAEFGAEDSAQIARELSRSLTERTDAWKASMMATGDPEGVGLVEDLLLVEIYRSRALIGLAQTALEQDRPRQALAFVQMAQDMSQSRTIGPVNTPLLNALLAEANLRTGHVREALEPLEVLSRSFPEVSGLDEIVGDLSVLQGLNRQGDSKEL